MTYALCLSVLGDLQFRDWTFTLGPLGEGWYLQAMFVAPGPTGTMDGASLQRGRKWYVSPYATVGEVVQTALKAVLTALEHEAREQFLFKGRAIFGPHLDVYALHEMAPQTVERAEAAHG
jgi:hypothetical protein